MSESPAGRRYFIRPVAWIAFAMALLAVPIVGYMVEVGLAWDQIHPAMNAMLNATSAVFLVAGGMAIRVRDVERHRACMVAAFVTSSIFLASYLARAAMSGTHVYPGDGWDRTAYLAILFSHMILAAAVVPLVLRALYLAWKGRYERHRRVARITWPIWLYVSVTGVAVYLMLYPIASALH